MKILLAISSLGVGGAETHLISLSQFLARQGDQVTVASSGGVLVKQLTEAGIRHVTVPMERANPLSMAVAFLTLRRLIREERFDLLHAHARIPAFLLSMIAGRLRIPFVTTVHARFSTEFPRRRLSRWGDQCIAVSEDLRQYLAEEYGVSPLRTQVIPNGIDTQRFAPLSSAEREKRAEAERQGGKRFRLLFVSRLDTDCAAVPYALCRLGRTLADEIEGLEILICGGGDALSSVRRMAKQVNDAVGRCLIRVPGRVQNLPQLLRQADTVCAVSRAALEAMACGVPVILGGNEGYLGPLEPKNFLSAETSNFCCRGEAELTDEALHEELLRMAARSPDERQRMGEALRKLVCERHELAVVGARTRQVYEAAIRETVKGRGEVVLCGYYGFGNLGDDALLRGAICRARERYPNQRISALTGRGKADEARFGVRCVDRRNLPAVLREISHARLFVFGGGTLLQDESSFRSLLFYSSLLRYAAKRGVPCELWGNGLGPLSGSRGRDMARHALLGCTEVECRDKQSARLARELLQGQRTPRVRWGKDLALGTKPCDKSRQRFLLERSFGKGKLPEFAVVALRGGEGKGYLKSCARWLLRLRGDGVELLFVNMFPKEDRRVSERFCQHLQGRMLTEISEADLMAIMKDACLVCGMRLHALVMAYAAGTPFVGFGGEEKVRSFCRENGGVYFTDLYGSSALS